ncbi:hypothetical protein J9B83_08220 [Marinomonas sp. A79]|uniref:Uncharacterized protein n=1 Tax=Marinomonas vulgaris TaxID=2823372 RepID=A0ABS5HBA2_9GAMM|nr:hypothetical protein [Marinomonas vulgaris]MBR7888931.1 hypothetical protein [Marinomonas vulgaris]
MSDLATSHDDGTFEPDEDALMSALRNQDDIPILMDIVVDGAAASYPRSTSQEAHLQHSFDVKDAPLDNETTELSPPAQTTHTEKPITQSDTLIVSSEQINRAIVDVLEKRLPELMTALVAEVMQNLQASTTAEDTAGAKASTDSQPRP